MSKARNRGVKTPYAIYYKDGSYMIYDLTSKDYETIKMSFAHTRFAEISVGLLATDEIRAIIEQKVQKKEKEFEPKQAVPDMSEEERTYLRQALAGIYDKEVDFS